MRCRWTQPYGAKENLPFLGFAEVFRVCWDKAVGQKFLELSFSLRHSHHAVSMTNACLNCKSFKRIKIKWWSLPKLCLLHEIFTIQLCLTVRMWWTICYLTDVRSVWLNSQLLRLYARHFGRICILSIARYAPEQVSRLPLTWGLKAYRFLRWDFHPLMTVLAVRSFIMAQRVSLSIDTNSIIDLKLLCSSLRGCRLMGKIFCIMLIISSQCPYICFASLVVVIINRLKWRAGSRS